MPAALNFARTPIPAVNQPPPPLNPPDPNRRVILDPRAGLGVAPPAPVPQPVLAPPVAPAAAPAPAPEEEPAQKPKAREILETISKVLANVNASLRGAELPFTAEKIREQQVAEEAAQYKRADFAIKFSKLTPQQQRTATAELQAKAPGLLKSGEIKGLLEASTKEEEAAILADLEAQIDLMPGAREHIKIMALREGLTISEYRKKYPDQVAGWNTAWAIDTYRRLRADMAAQITQTAKGQEYAEILEEEGVDIGDLVNNPGVVPPALLMEIQKNPALFPGINSPESEKEERAHQRALELKDIEQSGLRERAGVRETNEERRYQQTEKRLGEDEPAQFEILSPEEAREKGLPADSAAFKINRKTGDTTKVADIERPEALSKDVRAKLNEDRVKLKGLVAELEGFENVTSATGVLSGLAALYEALTATAQQFAGKEPTVRYQKTMEARSKARRLTEQIIAATAYLGRDALADRERRLKALTVNADEWIVNSEVAAQNLKEVVKIFQQRIAEADALLEPGKKEPGKKTATPPPAKGKAGDPLGIFE